MLKQAAQAPEQLVPQFKPVGLLYLTSHAWTTSGGRHERDALKVSRLPLSVGFKHRPFMLDFALPES